MQLAGEVASYTGTVALPVLARQLIQRQACTISLCTHARRSSNCTFELCCTDNEAFVHVPGMSRCVETCTPTYRTSLVCNVCVPLLWYQVSPCSIQREAGKPVEDIVCGVDDDKHITPQVGWDGRSAVVKEVQGLRGMYLWFVGVCWDRVSRRCLVPATRLLWNRCAR